MRELSKMQQRIYDYLADFIREQGYAPSVREIGDVLDISEAAVKTRLSRGRARLRLLLKET